MAIPAADVITRQIDPLARPSVLSLIVDVPFLTVSETEPGFEHPRCSVAILAED